METSRLETIQEAIKVRRSRRAYSPEPLPEEIIQELQELLDVYNALGQVDMRMVINNGKAISGVRNSYGLFSGVRNYLGLIAYGNDTASYEHLGYYGEAWILRATMLGLGTCWVGGTFNRGLIPFALSDDKKIICTIPFGYVSDEPSGREKLIKRFTGRSSKTIEEMVSQESDELPDWFNAGMEMVQRAPSASNKQPVLFTYKEAVASASVSHASDQILDSSLFPAVTNEMLALDFGIAKLHFEIGVVGSDWDLGKGDWCWDWGNGGKFHRND